jgi:hypothetical protein
MGRFQDITPELARQIITRQKQDIISKLEEQNIGRSAEAELPFETDQINNEDLKTLLITSDRMSDGTLPLFKDGTNLNVLKIQTLPTGRTTFLITQLTTGKKTEFHTPHWVLQFMSSDSMPPNQTMMNDIRSIGRQNPEFKAFVKSGVKWTPIAGGREVIQSDVIHRSGLDEVLFSTEAEKNASALTTETKRMEAGLRAVTQPANINQAASRAVEQESNVEIGPTATSHPDADVYEKGTEKELRAAKERSDALKADLATRVREASGAFDEAAKSVGRTIKQASRVDSPANSAIDRLKSRGAEIDFESLPGLDEKAVARDSNAFQSNLDRAMEETANNRLNEASRVWGEHLQQIEEKVPKSGISDALAGVIPLSRGLLDRQIPHTQVLVERAKDFLDKTYTRLATLRLVQSAITTEDLKEHMERTIQLTEDSMADVHNALLEAVSMVSSLRAILTVFEQAYHHYTGSPAPTTSVPPSVIHRPIQHLPSHYKTHVFGDIGEIVSKRRGKREREKQAEAEAAAAEERIKGVRARQAAARQRNRDEVERLEKEAAEKKKKEDDATAKAILDRQRIEARKRAQALKKRPISDSPESSETQTEEKKMADAPGEKKVEPKRQKVGDVDLDYGEFLFRTKESPPTSGYKNLGVEIHNIPRTGDVSIPVAPNLKIYGDITRTLMNMNPDRSDGYINQLTPQAISHAIPRLSRWINEHVGDIQVEPKRSAMIKNMIKLYKASARAMQGRPRRTHEPKTSGSGMNKRNLPVCMKTFAKSFGGSGRAPKSFLSKEIRKRAKLLRASVEAGNDLPTTDAMKAAKRLSTIVKGVKTKRAASQFVDLTSRLLADGIITGTKVDDLLHRYF